MVDGRSSMALGWQDFLAWFFSSTNKSTPPVDMIAPLINMSAPLVSMTTPPVAMITRLVNWLTSWDLASCRVFLAGFLVAL
jgi:hypothetical protein